MSSESTATPAPRGLFVTIRERLAGRSDSEHEQSLIRVVIASLVLLYLLFANANGKLALDQRHMVLVIGSALAIATGIFSLIVIWPQASPLRRLVAMTLDFGILSYLMYVLEDKGILFFSLYLWVTVGYGLRYGALYLYTAMAISIVSFTVVFSNSAYWREQWGFSAGLLIGLIALPLYFSSLLKQLRDQNDKLKALYEQMARHATHDSLTNLPNRKHFNDHLAETITSAKRDKQTFAVLYLDLDGFKAINDALGHAVGDQLIEDTARRLNQCVRKGDMVARVGGDEFVVLLRNVALHDVPKVAEKIIEILSEPFTIAAKTLRITASIGVAAYPQDGIDAKALIHSADCAMYETKRSGKNGFRICGSFQAQIALLHASDQAI
ncbi:MAG: GGDEF domain-containing protein [Sulfuricaulis sp.]|nr:GGDEF domain-containing protein [Sulfuricaulis sp.]